MIFTGVRLLHRLWAFSKKDNLHRRSPSSQALGLLGVEPPKVLDVPCVLDRHPLLSLQARGARPGNMNNLERALPHGIELVQSLPGDNPPEHEVSYLESSGADVAAVISSQCLLVPCRSQRGFSAAFLPQHEVHPPHGVLLRLVERQDPCGATPDLVRKDCFGSIDQEERGLPGRLGRGCADGPQHGLELVVPTPAAGLQLLLECPGLEASQDLRVGSFGLPIASRVCHRSVAYLRPKVSAICFEEITGELRTVVCDDAVWHPEPAHDTPDELDRGARGDGTDNLHLCPLGELVNGDVEVAVAPWRPREWAQNIQPPNCEWPREGYSLQAPRRLMDLLGMKLAGLTSLY